MTNDMYRLLDNHHASQAAAAAALRPVADECCAETGWGARAGVARIMANDAGGYYTVTEQRWNSATSQWQDANEPPGYVARTARDCSGQSSGTVGQHVRFWEQRAKGGALELLIDLGAEGTHKVMVSYNDTTPDYLAAKLADFPGDETYIAADFVGQNDGGNETITVKIAKSHVQAAVDTGMEHYVDTRVQATAAGTVTVHEGNWMGRAIILHWNDYCGTLSQSNSDVWHLSAGASGDRWETGFVGPNATGQHYLVDSSVSAATLRVYVDGNDGGKLKVQYLSFVPGYTEHLRLYGFASVRKNYPDHTIS